MKIKPILVSLIVALGVFGSLGTTAFAACTTNVQQQYHNGGNGGQCSGGNGGQWSGGNGGKLSGGNGGQCSGSNGGKLSGGNGGQWSGGNGGQCAFPVLSISPVACVSSDISINLSL